ncbi:hypothetical protein M422DRAFT_63621 [Sphaerobolus stellatus SS14]|nr:hypothetical protein M422DRAFT_63621 [Sphaerobolus stellatus SS14]
MSGRYTLTSEPSSSKNVGGGRKAGKQRVQPTFSVGKRYGQSDMPPELLESVPNDHRNPPPSRAYYPFEHLQRQFDKWEQEHPGEISPGANGNLTMLQDGPPGAPPPYALRELMIAAINGAPERKLTLREIRVALIRRFEWFARSKDDSKGWKTTVRWNLNQCSTFTRIPRQRTADDPGSWWTLTSDNPPDLNPYKYVEKRMDRGQYKAKDHSDPENPPWKENILSFSDDEEGSYTDPEDSASYSPACPTRPVLEPPVLFRHAPQRTLSYSNIDPFASTTDYIQQPLYQLPPIAQYGQMPGGNVPTLPALQDTGLLMEGRHVVYPFQSHYPSTSSRPYSRRRDM